MDKGVLLVDFLQSNGCLRLTLKNLSEETLSLSCSNHTAVVFLIKNVPL